METSTTTESTTTESIKSEKVKHLVDAVEPIVDSALSLGLVWAKYGVSVAGLALKTQAASLQHLSTLLKNVADALATKAEAQDAAAAEERPAA